MPAQKFPDLNSQSTSAESVVESHIAGTYSLERISLTLRNGQEISLSETMTSLILYEDVYNPNISGSIEIIDFVGGLEKFQLTGGETIKVKIYKPNLEDILIDRSDLVVHSISKGRVVANNSIQYSLDFISSSAIRSQKKRIFKSWGKERSISKIVKDLCSEMNTPVNISDSMPTLDKTFICPGYTPTGAINFLAKRAGAVGDYFLFFERVSTGKVFAGMSNLRALAPKLSDGDGNNIYTIIYQPSITYNESSGAETKLRAETVEPQDNFNHISNMSKGLYESKLTNINIARRTFRTYDFNYRNRPNDFYINDIVNKNSIFGRFERNEKPGERLYTLAINDPMKSKTEWIKSDMHGSLMTMGMRINVTVDGGTNQLGAGDIVNLILPSDFAKTIDPNSSDVIENNMYSGKYFVTACKHIITNEIYSKYIELARSSVRETLENNDSLIEDTRVTPAEGYLTNATLEVRQTRTTEDTNAGYLSEAYISNYASYSEQDGQYVPDNIPQIESPTIVSNTDANGVVTQYAIDSRIKTSVRTDIINNGNFGDTGN